ncbi:MAG: FAD binding domain-containing protein [Rhodobacteraceae bacterium]|nr:FAD binding domain-containing protein [Paracoccaceae bacterium]
MSAEMDFELATPKDASEAVAQMQANPGACYIAGGTDLVANLRRGIGAPPMLIALDGIAEMQTIAEDGTHLVIGASVTLARLMAEGLPKRFAAMSALAEVAGPGLREAATIGGNLCLDTRCIFYNQSKWWRKANGYCLKLDGDTCHVAPKGKRCHAAFSGDVAPALLVLGAEVQVVGSGGARWMKLADLYREDGLDHLTLGPGELLVAVRIPLAAAALHSGYAKSRLRKAVDFPLAGVAVALDCKDGRIADLKVALTGTNPRPILFDHFPDAIGQEPTEAVLDAISKDIGKEITPMRTTNMPGMYRRQMAGVLVKRLITRLCAGQGAKV